MKFEEIEDSGVLALMGQSSGPRSRDKLHVSDIYKSLNKKLDPERFNDDKGPNAEKMEVGLLFESILEEALARKYGTLRPGETMLDNVWMSPDGVNPDAEALEEFKCTWMSSRHGLIDVFGYPHTKFQHWFWQMKAYCLALGCTKAILTVLFVNGDYDRKNGMNPQLKRYAIEFTPDELDENWQMLLRHAREEGLLS
jgi:hypothetical protein